MTKSGSFIIYCIPGNTKSTRVGICTGKSLGNAVKRNRLKRQIRQALRNLEFECGDKDIAIVARKSVLERDFHFISRDLKGLLAKALLK